jgi:transposase
MRSCIGTARAFPGLPWRELPERFGAWKNVHRRFSRWAHSAIWETLFHHLTTDADPEYVRIDSTIVRAHQHSAGAPGSTPNPNQEAIGRSRGGLTTKIHALVDALGNPPAFLRTPGQTHDLVGAEHRLPDGAAETVIADKAYDAEDCVIRPLEQVGKGVVIPPKSHRRNPRTSDRDLDKARHLIENFFCTIKQFRAIATRHDKLSRNFQAAIHFAAALIWLN